MKKKAFGLSAAFLILLTGMGAVSFGAALFVSGQNSRLPGNSTQSARADSIPHSVSFREVHGRGLLVTVWINSAGPFTFAIDTGAGATILSPRVATEAGVSVREGRCNHHERLAKRSRWIIGSKRCFWAFWLCDRFASW